MKNKAVVITIASLILLSSSFTLQGHANATSSGDYEYLLIDSNAAAEITGYTGAGGVISIPITLDGYPVTSIASGAFESDSTLTEVVVPTGVISIGSGAFDNCTLLASVTLPEGLITIGDGAFYDCHSLTSIVLPQSLVSIQGYAFVSTGLTTITIPDSVADVGDNVFQGCLGLTSVTFPRGLDYISSGEFSGCHGLTTINIPEEVISIGDGAFYDCGSLTSITLPDNLTILGGSAFQGCIALSAVVLGSDLSNIGSAAFYNCSSLTSLTIPENVTEIGYAAFSGCSGLTSVKIGSSVVSISALTFYDCHSLTSVEIPDKVSFIGYGAFSNCTSLVSATIGSGVMEIGQSAFEDCTSLTSMTFKSNQPSLTSNWIAGPGSGLVVRYYKGASGFTTPSWQSIPTEMNSTLAAPQNVTAVPGIGSVSISWSGLQGNGSENIDYYIIYQNGVDVMHAPSGTEANISVLANGREYIFQVAAHDAAGPGLNSSSVTAEPIYDPNWMMIVITSPENNAFLASGEVILRWTIGAAVSSISNIELSVDGGSPVALPGDATSYSFTGLAERSHTVNVSAADVLGSTCTVGVFFTVDLTPPSVVQFTPTGNAVSTRTDIVITFSEPMNRNLTDIGLVGSAGSTAWNGTVATFVPASTLLGNTSFVVHLTGIDRSGNALNTTTWTFSTANVGTISGKITDEGERGVANATVTLTGTSSSDIGAVLTTKTNGSGNYAFYDVAPGNYAITVSKDGYGTITAHIDMTSESIAVGGVTTNFTVQLHSSSNDVLPLLGMVGGGVTIAALLAFIVVRRKNKKN
jgi:hypothetical protein